jgi:hypothetical protein
MVAFAGQWWKASSGPDLGLYIEALEPECGPTDNDRDQGYGVYTHDTDSEPSRKLRRTVNDVIKRNSK